MSDNINKFIKDELLCHGADLVGFGDLTELPPELRENLPVGICVAVKYPKEIIRGISELPTAEYHDRYNFINKKLDMLAELGASALEMFGYKAIAQTREYVWQQTGENQIALLPHKTVATRAGMGWIGKCALLVTKEFGSMIRISSILTDAPLKTAKPINKSKCGNCTECTDYCPANAVSGKLWTAKLARDEFFNAAACEQTARERSFKGLGTEITICGKCIEVCPYTKMYLDS